MNEEQKIISKLLISKKKSDKIKDKQINNNTIRLTKSEVKVLLNWLQDDARNKWRKAGYSGIEGIYNKLSNFYGKSNIIKKWKWKTDKTKIIKKVVLG